MCGECMCVVSVCVCLQKNGVSVVCACAIHDMVENNCDPRRLSL